MFKELFNFKFIGSLIISLLILFRINLVISGIISVVYLIIFIFYNFKINRRFYYTCLEILIYTLPFSFTSLFPQLNFLSLFILCQIMMTINGCLNIKKSNKFSSFILIFIILVNIIYIIFLGLSTNLYYEVIIKMNIFLTSLYIIANNFRLKYEEVSELEKKFIMVSLIGGVTIFLQYYFNKYLGITTLGTQSKMGELRQGFSGLFYDYSIMSIYMSGTAGLLIFKLINKKNIFNKFIDVILIFILIFVSALTSARSGLAALFLSLAVFILWKKNIKVFIIGSILAIPSLYLILQFVSKTRGTTVTNDSGRMNNINESLDYVLENPLFGSGGLGYNSITNNMLPHNFIVDFLTDFGIILFIFYCMIMAYIIKVGIRYNVELSFLFLLYMFGGMFHASFINTHYIIFPIFTILAIKNQYK